MLDSSHILTIIILEIIALLCISVVVLVFRNRSLKKLVKKLRKRMRELIGEIKKQGGAGGAALGGGIEGPKESDEEAYRRLVQTQISVTKSRHAELNAGQDIVLDLAPETPLSRRATALRYALLLAEKEAMANRSKQEPDWSKLNEKYERIFRFYEDFQLDEGEPVGNADQLADLEDALESANKRVKNLEKFKSLFFDLEEQLKNAKQVSETHYAELAQMSTQVDNSEAYDDLLKNYHSAYDGLARSIEDGSDKAIEIVKEQVIDTATATELHNLRAVTANQHKVIEELQRKLEEVDSEEARSEFVNTLKEELKKQERFAQEADACVKLMEDELETTKLELEQLKSKVTTMSQIRAQLKELRHDKEESDLELSSLKSENRRLRTKLKTVAQAAPETSAETHKLKKEITNLQSEYADLEEKYLDLKLQH